MRRHDFSGFDRLLDNLPRALLDENIKTAGGRFRFTRARFFCNRLHWWWISVWLVVTLDKQHSQRNHRRLQILGLTRTPVSTLTQIAAT